MIRRALVIAVVALTGASEAAAQPRILRVDENTPRRRDAPAAEQSPTGQIVSDQETEARELLRLRGLDTLNGTTEDIPLAVGETVRYGHLEIRAEACRVPSADPEGEAYALLEIRDVREDAARFDGWMFASSPALSALDHPRYDVWVLSCSNR